MFSKIINFFSINKLNVPDLTSLKGVSENTGAWKSRTKWPSGYRSKEYMKECHDDIMRLGSHPQDCVSACACVCACVRKYYQI